MSCCDVSVLLFIGLLLAVSFVGVFSNVLLATSVWLFPDRNSTNAKNDETISIHSHDGHLTVMLSK